MLGKSWHPDPTIHLSIEQRRTSLSIRFMKKLNKWLEEHKQENTDQKVHEAMTKMKAIFLGKAEKLTLRLLDGLEKCASQMLDVQRIVNKIDLTASDDESDPVPQEVSVISIQDSPPASPRVEDIDYRPRILEDLRLDLAREMLELSQKTVDTPQTSPDVDSNANLVFKTVSNLSKVGSNVQRNNVTQNPPKVIQSSPNVTSNTRKLPEYIPSPPQITSNVPQNIPEPSNSPSTSLHSSSPSTSYSSPRNSSRPLPQRRKSLGGIAKEQPSISDYKIKHKILPAPGIYAKPNEKEAKPRNIISVPYKTAPKQQPKMDPREEAIKIKGIKEKIYQNIYLKSEEDKDKERQRSKNRTESESDKTEVEKESPEVEKQRKSRRKSTAQKIFSQKTEPRTRSKSASSTARKRNLPRISSSDEDDEYVPPDHVLEGIESQAEEVRKAVEEEFAPKKRRKSIAEKKTEESQPKPIPKMSFSERRMTRSKSAYIEKPANLDESFGIEVLNEPAGNSGNSQKSKIENPVTAAPSRVQIPGKKLEVTRKRGRPKTYNSDSDSSSSEEIEEEWPQRPPTPPRKPQNHPKNGVARKRGRPAKMKNIVTQAATEALKLPSDIVFSPIRFKHNDSVDIPEEENLLIEVPGKLKTIKRTTELRPRFQRRRESPPPVELQSEIKEEPVDPPDE